MEIIKKKKRNDVHPYIPELKELYRGGRITRREFIRNAAMLGLSLSSASAFLAACAPATPEVVEKEVIVEKEVPVTVEVEKEVVLEKVVTATPSAAVKRGGILRFEYSWIPYMDDPATDGVGTGEVSRNIAETLLWVDVDNVPHPLLCERWEASEDAKEWTLYLQQGVTFNNGKPFNADDVMWNFQHWLDPDVGSPMRDRLAFLSSTGVEKVDDYTVKLHLDRAFYGIPWSLHGFLAMIAPEGGWDDFYYGDAEHAIGTGPFLMKEFIPDERMELVRREDYWQNGVDGKPLPYLDGVRVVVYQEDAARLAGLVGDEVDRILPGEGIVEELEKHPGDIVVASIDTGWSSPIFPNCGLAPFDDPRVRSALKWCQDRERIRELCMPKGRLAWDHWIHPFHDGYCPDTDKDRPQDIERAKALLAEAGYPDGFETQLSSPTSPEHRPMAAQVLKEMAAQAGIRINVKVFPDSVYWDTQDDAPIRVSGWSGRPLGTDNLRTGLTCGGVWNSTQWCNEEFDALLTEAESAVDVEKRRGLFCQLQRLMQDESPVVLSFWNVEYDAYRTRVHGFPLGKNFYFHHVWLS